MDDRILKWLYDIDISIKEIESYFDGEMIFGEYKMNIMLKRAVERDLEIIGEATNRILKFDPTFELKITESKSIISLRNQVIHSYDNISDEKIWAILINHLPVLKSEVQNILKPYLLD
jgi:uncharacterized protein with HEPN domain